MTPDSTVPLDLGRLATLDPLSLEPGMIVWDRFCVVGAVEHASAVWTVPVTDLVRELGHPPHHRVTLTYLSLDEPEQRRIHRALVADAQVQARVRATIDLSRGIALVHDPVAGDHLGTNLPPFAARALALTLAGLLVRLHEAEVWGLDLRASNLRQRGGEFLLNGFHHLMGTGAAIQDIEAVTALLRRVAGTHVASLLEPPAKTAGELWSRARALARGHAPLVTPLSRQPPFVGREQPLEALERALFDAQIARSSVSLVCAAQGLGKTRLLDEFAASLRARDAALVIRGEYLRGCGESRAGLRGALAELPKALANSPAETRERTRDRLRRRVGPVGRATLARYAPGLAELLGEPEPRAGERERERERDDEGFGHHAVAVTDAIRSLGDQTRPLVILLDNLQLADLGSIALLRQLLIEDRSHHTMIVAALAGSAPLGLADPVDETSWNPDRDPQLLLRRIMLEPLDRDELERLLVAGLPGPVENPRELAEVLLETSRGNPLLGWATLESWIDTKVLTRGDAQPWVLHRRKVAKTSPAKVFGERLERASLDERWLVLLAALAGGHVDGAWLQRVSAWDPSRVAAAVDGLERHGLLGRAGEASLRFPHQLVRQLVIERSSAGDIRRGHARIADWLASLGPRVSAARLAYHTDSALGHRAGRDSSLAEMHLAAGREMLGVFDLERSGWHFTRALSEHRGPSGGRIAAIEGAADVALLADKRAEAAQFYAEAVAECDDPLVAVRIAAKAVQGLFRKSAAREAANIGRLALALADQPLPGSEQRLRTRVAALQAKLGQRLRRSLGASAGPAIDPNLREQLCWLYTRMALVLALPEPEVAQLCLVRARTHADGLDSPAAASVQALHGAQLAIRGEQALAMVALRDATELAQGLGHDRALGLTEHVRGQFIELAYGDYTAGLASLDRAIVSCRRTGDLSLAISSLALKAVYGHDREPAQTIHDWLDEATALNEIQGNTVVDLVVEALRLLVRARSGARHVAEAATGLAARATSRRLIGFEGYLVYTYLALALLEVGEQPRARAQIDLAHARITAHGPIPEFAPEFTCELWAATALVLLESPGSSRDGQRLAAAIRRLDAAAQRSPRAAALAQFVAMRQANQLGKRDAARLAAESLIAELRRHGQTRLALEAHRSLAELLRGRDVLAAREHLRLAQEFSEQLGLDQARERERERERVADELDVPRARGRERSSRRHSNAYLRAIARNELVEVAELLEGSRPVLLETVGDVAWIYLRADPELRVYAERLELQSLLVHLALCARDSVVEPEQLRVVATVAELDEDAACAIPGASAGRWGRIAVTVVGTPTPIGVTGGVSACRQVATRLGGFLELVNADNQATLAVHLPSERSSKRGSANDASTTSGAYVLHPDALIRETLTAAITRLGHSCTSGSPTMIDARELPAVEILFVDGETLHDLDGALPPGQTTVELIGRGLPTRSEHPTLRVPFALGELRRFLDPN